MINNLLAQIKYLFPEHFNGVLILLTTINDKVIFKKKREKI